MKPLLLVGLLASADIATPEYLVELARFNHVYNQFFRDLMGCPAKASSVEDCNPKLGLLNQAALKQVTEQAARVFPQPKKKERKTPRRWWLLWTK